MSIRLNLKAAFAALLRSSDSADVEASKREPSSIVFLLRKPDFVNLEQLRTAGERAFWVPFSTGNSTDFCVFTKVFFTLMQIGPDVLSFMFCTTPYLDEKPSAFGRAMPLPVQRAAWKEHSAWMAVNYARGPADPDTQSAILSKLCIEMLGGNCTGAYVPGEQLFIPNDSSLLAALQQNASLLSYLNPPPYSSR
jgi:hypothetical protein